MQPIWVNFGGFRMDLLKRVRIGKLRIRGSEDLRRDAFSRHGEALVIYIEIKKYTVYVELIHRL